METAFVYFVLAEPLRDPEIVDALFEAVRDHEKFVMAAGDLDDHCERFKTEDTAEFGYIAEGGGFDLGLHDGTTTDEKVLDPIADYPLFYIQNSNKKYEHGGEFDGSDAQDNTEALIDETVRWYEWLVDHGVGVKYVFGDGGNRRLTLAHDGPKFTEYQIETDRVGEVYWLQILPPATVENHGRETVASAPFYRVEELADGGYLLLQRPNPWFDSPANEEYGFDELLAHLRTGD